MTDQFAPVESKVHQSKRHRVSVGRGFCPALSTLPLLFVIFAAVLFWSAGTSVWAQNAAECEEHAAQRGAYDRDFQYFFADTRTLNFPDCLDQLSIYDSVPILSYAQAIKNRTRTVGQTPQISDRSFRAHDLTLGANCRYSRQISCYLVSALASFNRSEHLFCRLSMADTHAADYRYFEPTLPLLTVFTELALAELLLKSAAYLDEQGKYYRDLIDLIWRAAYVLRSSVVAARHDVSGEHELSDRSPDSLFDCPTIYRYHRENQTNLSYDLDGIFPTTIGEMTEAALLGKAEDFPITWSTVVLADHEQELVDLLDSGFPPETMTTEMRAKMIALYEEATSQWWFSIFYPH